MSLETSPGCSTEGNFLVRFKPRTLCLIFKYLSEKNRVLTRCMHQRRDDEDIRFDEKDTLVGIVERSFVAAKLFFSAARKVRSVFMSSGV